MLRSLAAAALAAALVAAPVVLADDRGPAALPAAHTIAVIGDTPYGDAQIATFRADVAQINGDPAVRRVIHLGDIKNGSSRCDDAYFLARRADFDTFDDPLAYTPGDNEWTDCHRANNGGYVPTERLARLREVFFDRPGRTLGDRDRVDFQSRALPENVMWQAAGVPFGLVHLVGSNDGQLAWFGDRRDAATGAPRPETVAETALRSREYVAREAAALLWIDRLFDVAEARRAPAVVLGMQADMWDGAPAGQTAFAPIKAVIADRAQRFGRPVLLLQGDSHVFKVDTPAGMPPNLTRVVVQGSTSEPREYLRVRVAPRSETVFSCENVVFESGSAVACPAPLAPL